MKKVNNTICSVCGFAHEINVEEHSIENRCAHCKRKLRRDCFSKNKSEKNGLQTWCKYCLSKRGDKNSNVLENSKSEEWNNKKAVQVELPVANDNGWAYFTPGDLLTKLESLTGKVNNSAEWIAFGLLMSLGYDVVNKNIIGYDQATGQFSRREFDGADLEARNPITGETYFIEATRGNQAEIDKKIKEVRKIKLTDPNTQFSTVCAVNLEAFKVKFTPIAPKKLI